MTYTELMTILCIQYKVVTVPYFLDEMKSYELRPLMENLSLSLQDGWERTRMQMYASIQPYSKKKLSPKNILEFPWEKKENKPKLPKVEMTKELREQMIKRAEEVKDRLQKEGAI